MEASPDTVQYCEGEQHMSSQNTPLEPEDYFKLIILRNSRRRRSSEDGVDLTLPKGQLARL